MRLGIDESGEGDLADAAIPFIEYKIEFVIFKDNVVGRRELARFQEGAGDNSRSFYLIFLAREAALCL